MQPSSRLRSSPRVIKGPGAARAARAPARLAGTAPAALEPPPLLMELQVWRFTAQERRGVRLRAGEQSGGSAQHTQRSRARPRSPGGAQPARTPVPAVRPCRELPASTGEHWLGTSP